MRDRAQSEEFAALLRLHAALPAFETERMQDSLARFAEFREAEESAMLQRREPENSKELGRPWILLSPLRTLYHSKGIVALYS